MKKIFAIIVSVTTIFILYGSMATAEEPDLVLHFNFNEKSTDGNVLLNNGSACLDTRLENLSLYKNNLPITVNPPERKKEGKNGVLSFNGESMLKVGPHTTLNSIERYTLMAWVNYKSWDDYPNASESRQEIMEKYGAFWMNIRRDKRELLVAFPIFNEDNTKIIENKRMKSKVKIPPDKWTHVAATFDPASDPTIKIYTNRNLNLKNDIKSITNSYYTNHPLIIGGRYADVCGKCTNKNICGQCPDAFLNGRIDDVRIYSRVLSEGEIETIFLKSRISDDMSNRKTCPSTIPPPNTIPPSNIRLLN